MLLLPSILASSIYDQAGFVNLHWSKKPCGEGCLMGDKCIRNYHHRQDQAYLCNPASLDWQNSANFYDMHESAQFYNTQEPAQCYNAQELENSSPCNLQAASHSSPFNLQAASCFGESNTAPDACGDASHSLFTAQENSLTPQGDPLDLSLDHVATNYNWSSSPLFGHTLCADCLLHEFSKTADFFQISCPCCGNFLSYYSMVDYVARVVLYSPEDADRSGTRHELANTLMISLLDILGELTFLYSLGIEHVGNIRAFRKYCEYLCNITGRDTARLKTLIEHLKVVETNIEHRRSLINDPSGKCQHEGDICDVTTLYLKSIRFTVYEPDIEFYLKILLLVKGDVQIQLYYAKVLFLINSVVFPVGNMMRYFIPYLTGQLPAANAGFSRYVEEYRGEYTAVETNEELLLEAIITTRSSINSDTNYRRALVKRYVSSKRNTLGRILNFILRNHSYSIGQDTAFWIIDNILMETSENFKGVDASQKDARAFISLFSACNHRWACSINPVEDQVFPGVITHSRTRSLTKTKNKIK